jgi:hypothetical protein
MWGVLHGRRVGKQIFYQFGKGVTAPEPGTIGIKRSAGTLRLIRSSRAPIR